jgi:hypothetical protein
MKVEVEQYPVDTPIGVRVNQLLIYQIEPVSRDLLVILPGRGYLRSHPVLHYLAMAALGGGYDVLALEYAFHTARGEIPAEWLMPDVLNAEIDAALDALPRRRYEDYTHVCIAGKSLGTPLAVTLAARRPASRTSLLMLTPVGGAMHMIGSLCLLLPTLAIIGTADAAFDSPAVAADDRPGITWRVFEGLNHGLESSGDWTASLEALRDITSVCRGFLDAQHTGQNP